MMSTVDGKRGASVEARREPELLPAAHARLWAVSAHLPMHAVSRARLWGAAVPKGKGSLQKAVAAPGLMVERSSAELLCELALIVQKSMQISMSWILQCLHGFLYLSNLFKASLGMSVLYRGLQCKYSLLLVPLALFSPLAFGISCTLLPLNPTVLTVSHFPSATVKMAVKTGEKSLLSW